MRIVNPATEEVLADVEETTAESIALEYDRARGARQELQALGFEERAARMRRFQELVQERREELARTLTSEVGKPITQSRVR